MTDPYLPQPREFRDLVPWADPYITSLLHKLRRAAAAEEGLAEEGLYVGDMAPSALDAELPPPLDKNDREAPWQADWSPRNWPRK